MSTLLFRAIAAVRAWLGLDPAENDPQPPHGWLLPSPSDFRAHALESMLKLAPIPVRVTTPGDRR
jgi:hypothetical protein